MDARDITLSVLLDMDTNNTFSNIAIDKALRREQFSDKGKRAFITRLAEGTTETRIRLDYIIDSFSKTKSDKLRPVIRCLLRMAVYQIMYMDSVPDSAAINESVRLAKAHGLGGLAGFVNGVLRNVARHKNDIKFPDYEDNKVLSLSVCYSVPEWLVDKLIRDYGDRAELILRGCLADRPTSVRINTVRTSKEDLKRIFEEDHITVSDGFYDDKALLISGYDFIRRINGYKQGLFTVQDESSMCAIRAAGIKPSNIVLDVAAAPGGKTTAAAEYLEGKGHVYSMDISEEKLSLIEDNVNRLGLDNVTIIAHDAEKPFFDENGKPIIADVVIADLPCSGLGVMGRKNDIKYRISERQIKELARFQRRILDNVKNHVKEGGILLYSTCTITPEENEDNVQWFLDANSDFKMVSERLFLQGVSHCDGFFYAVMRKNKEKA